MILFQLECLFFGGVVGDDKNKNYKNNSTVLLPIEMTFDIFQD